MEINGFTGKFLYKKVGEYIFFIKQTNYASFILPNY